MSTTGAGRTAEKRVAEHLKHYGYAIRNMNWRTRWCEIDIVAEKDSCMYFVEVKYRQRSDWGDGFDAITPSKLQQMSRAAEFWIQSKRWIGEVQLLAASVDDSDIKVIAL